jgi:hypothetical protein
MRGNLVCYVLGRTQIEGVREQGIEENILTLLLLLLLLLTANEFVPGGSGATIRHNNKTTHTTQTNTPHSK